MTEQETRVTTNEEQEHLLSVMGAGMATMNRDGSSARCQWVTTQPSGTGRLIEQCKDLAVIVDGYCVKHQP